MIKPYFMSDCTAVLLARAECRNNPSALKACDEFLGMFCDPHRVTFEDKIEDKS